MSSEVTFISLLEINLRCFSVTRTLDGVTSTSKFTTNTNIDYVSTRVGTRRTSKVFLLGTPNIYVVMVFHRPQPSLTSTDPSLVRRFRRLVYGNRPDICSQGLGTPEDPSRSKDHEVRDGNSSLHSRPPRVSTLDKCSPQLRDQKDRTRTCHSPLLLLSARDSPCDGVPPSFSVLKSTYVVFPLYLCADPTVASQSSGLTFRPRQVIVP